MRLSILTIILEISVVIAKQNACDYVRGYQSCDVPLYEWVCCNNGNYQACEGDTIATAGCLDNTPCTPGRTFFLQCDCRL